jgi:predicted alpha/beta hydrolase
MVRAILISLLLLTTISTWASKPLAKWWAKPDTLGLQYQSLSLTTPDKVNLASWLVEPDSKVPTKRTTIVLAGNDYGNMSYQLLQAQALASAGYRVLMFDYRGFGHSDNFAIDANRLYYQEFAIDLQTALAEARKRSPADKVGIIGYSMGTVLGAIVAAQGRSDFLITDSFLGNPQAAVDRIYAKSQRRITLPPEAGSYQQTVSKVNCPWLFIAGTEDQQAPLTEAEYAVKAGANRQKRQLIRVKCAHQGAMIALTVPKYAELIERFLAEQLPPSKG